MWIAPPLDDLELSVECDDALNIVTLFILPLVPFQYIAPPSSLRVEASWIETLITEQSLPPIAIAPPGPLKIVEFKIAEFEIVIFESVPMRIAPPPSPYPAERSSTWELKM